MQQSSGKKCGGKYQLLLVSLLGDGDWFGCVLVISFNVSYPCFANVYLLPKVQVMQ